MKDKKVLIAGLDNAGKTSFIKALDRKKITEMKPTLGIDLTYKDVLGFKIARWDLGGQINYRQNYFKDEANVFTNAALVFFLIDMLDIDRMEEALSYYEEILEVYKLVGENPAFIICLHKSDPDIFHDEDTLEALKIKQKELEQSFKNISEGFNIQIIKTSIFDRETLIRAFSLGVKAFLTNYDLLDLNLSDFINEVGLEKAIIYEKNSLILGESSSNKDITNPLNPAMMEFIVILDELQKTTNAVKLEISIDDKYSFVIYARSFEKYHFYLGLLGDKSVNFALAIEEFEKKYSDKISNVLKEMIA